jgi:hypothetical protein
MRFFTVMLPISIGLNSRLSELIELLSSRPAPERLSNCALAARYAGEISTGIPAVTQTPGS